MKRRFVLILLALLLTVACAAPSAASSQTTAVATAAAAAAAANSTQTAAADALTDPEDGTRAATDAFSLTSGAGAMEPEGSVYTITAAGEYTLSGALEDGQILVDAGDEAEVKLILKDAAIACSFGAPIYVRARRRYPSRRRRAPITPSAI